jgi:hypothetical protein
VGMRNEKQRQENKKVTGSEGREEQEDEEDEEAADDSNDGGERVDANPTPVRHKKVKKSVRRPRADPAVRDYFAGVRLPFLSSKIYTMKT